VNVICLGKNIDLPDIVYSVRDENIGQDLDELCIGRTKPKKR
jgi:hypothetical protein